MAQLTSRNHPVGTPVSTYPYNTLQMLKRCKPFSSAALSSSLSLHYLLVLEALVRALGSSEVFFLHRPVDKSNQEVFWLIVFNIYMRQ